MRNNLILGFCTVALATLSASAENWPCFRGPTRQGNSSESGVPLKWSATENVAWKTPIPGEAWSSPIVWGDGVFLTTATDNGTGCHVLALDRKTGQVLWDKEVFKQVTRRKESRNSYATPTPVTDGQRIYAVFADGSFVALTMDGQITWTNRELPFYSQHGLGTSPILFEDLLIMTRDGSSEGSQPRVGWQIPWDKSFVMALDKNTGKVRWKTFRGRSRIAHVVPNIHTGADGRAVLISGAGDVVQGYDAKTGELLWTSKNIGEGVVPSIVLGEGLAYTACGFSGRNSIKAFRLNAKGDAGETNLAWEQREAMPKVPSYLYLKPYLYTVDDGGVAMCLNGDNGQIKWKERLGGNYSASPVSAAGRIYFLSDHGLTTVVQAGPEFKVLARNPLDEHVQASMAISGGQLFIRTAKNLHCIGQK